MVPKWIADVKFHISPVACVTLALMLLMLPLRWILAAILAACVHEGGHLLAIRICGGSVGGFSVGNSGAVLFVDTISPVKQLICALCGPLGSLALLLLVNSCPRLAFCGAVQGAYNLLPLSHLDGGRTLHSVLTILVPRKALKICSIVQTLLLSILLFLGIYLWLIYSLGPIPLIFVVLLIRRAKKDLANSARNAYNRVDIDKGVRL